MAFISFFQKERLNLTTTDDRSVKTFCFRNAPKTPSAIVNIIVTVGWPSDGCCRNSTGDNDRMASGQLTVKSRLHYESGQATVMLLVGTLSGPVLIT